MIVFSTCIKCHHYVLIMYMHFIITFKGGSGVELCELSIANYYCKHYGLKFLGTGCNIHYVRRDGLIRYNKAIPHLY